MSLAIILIAVLFFLLICIFALIILGFKKRQPDSSTLTASMPIPATEIPATEKSEAKKTARGTLQGVKPGTWRIVAAIILVVALFVWLFGYTQSNPYADAESETLAYNASGVITQVRGGPDSISLTAGKGGVKGTIHLSDTIEPGKCAKIIFYADKEGGKLKAFFKPLYDSSPSNEGEEIAIGMLVDSKLWCYTETTGAKTEAIVTFDIPEGVTATFKTK